MALLYVLHVNGASLRLTDLAEQLHIDAPAVTQEGTAARTVRPGRPDQGLRGRAGDPAAAHRRGRPDGSAGSWLARRAWLTGLLSGWPESEQAEFARLLRQFTSDVDRHLGGLDG